MTACVHYKFLQVLNQLEPEGYNVVEVLEAHISLIVTAQGPPNLLAFKTLSSVLQDHST